MGFVETAKNYLWNLWVGSYVKKGQLRKEEYRELQAQHSDGGMVTKIEVYEANLHLRNQMEIPKQEITVQGGQGTWKVVPNTTPPDTILRLNWVVMKGITTGCFQLPKDDGTMKEWGPGKENGIFTATHALAWKLAIPQRINPKTSVIQNILLFDREMANLLNGFRLYDDQMRYTG